MAEQAAPVGVVIMPRSGGALEAGPEFLKKQIAQTTQTRIAHGLHKLPHIRKVLFQRSRLLLAADEKFRRFLRIQHAHPPAPGIEAEAAIHGKFPFDLHALATSEFLTGRKGVGVRPCPKRENIAGVADLHFPIWFAV